MGKKYSRGCPVGFFSSWYRQTSDRCNPAHPNSGESGCKISTRGRRFYPRQSGVLLLIVLVTIVFMTLAALTFMSLMQVEEQACLLYTSPSPRDQRGSRMPSSA